MRKQHDLALVKLNAPVALTDYISPVCLPPANYSLSAGTLCYVTGWGDTYGKTLTSKYNIDSINIVYFHHTICNTRLYITE